MLELETGHSMSNVPNITYEALDKFAEKVAQDFMPETLQHPRPFDVRRFLESYLGLTVCFRRIDHKYFVLAISAFNEGFLQIIDEYSTRIEPMPITAGMVVIDTSLTAKRNLPRLRFASMHEGAHWLLHKKAFSQDNPFGPAGIFDNPYFAAKSGKIDYSRSQIERTDYEQIERQADFIASALLMPRPALRIAYKNYFNQCGEKTHRIVRGAKSGDDIHAKKMPEYIANVFGVSKRAALIRLEKLDAIVDTGFGFYQNSSFNPYDEEQYIDDDMKYTFVVHGFAPDLWSGSIVFRKAKGFAAEKQKIVNCPYCGRRLASIGVSTTIQIYRSPNKAELNCHEYKTCNICHGTVGIIFSS